MIIDITKEAKVTRVFMISENINWILFGDNLRIELTREQLNSIVEQIDFAKKVYEAVGIN